ncbi:ankyrin repeat-containing domain protein [Cercophora newfieldiana]|uniref:Ankyrin repeat-containing domain protein n=1 Tax=Cercophora newfieldiana TaxID=92897 RepID=A0AA39XUM9_9PEZI|nr:ankyrin repeat-containing domain protein [Cercophora newfieldiana]
MSSDNQAELTLAKTSYCEGNRDALPTILQFWTSNQGTSTGLGLLTPWETSLSEVLHEAIWRGYTSDVQTILDAGVPPTLRSPHGGYDTPLFAAARIGQRDIARLFWQRVGQYGRFYQPDMRRDMGHPSSNQSCIGVAAQAGHAALVAEFLGLWNGWTPGEMRYALLAAAAEWQSDTVDLLLDRVMTYTPDDIQDALAVAVTPSADAEDDIVLARQYNLVCRLADAGADTNGFTSGISWPAGPMLVVAACSAGSLGLLKGLLEKWAKPNIQDPETGQTALQQYRLHDGMSHSIATPKALLDRGASPERADYEGETPMHAIALAGTLEELQLYLDHCVDADTTLHRQNLHGETLLHYAAAGKNVDVVGFLIYSGLDVNAINNNGWTPLICEVMPTGRAGLSAAEDVANLLLHHGARADTITAENWTPMHALGSWALLDGDNDEKEMLQIRLGKELISRGAALDAEARVLRGKDVKPYTVCGKWGFRMQRLAEMEERRTKEAVPDEETMPHLWACRTGAMGLFQVILDYWASEAEAQ